MTADLSDTQAISDASSRRPGRDLAVGEVVGDYVIASKLGEGGFGSVYRVTHKVIGRVFALKILRAALDANPDAISRFIEEARASSRSRHPNIVDVFAFGQLPDGRPWYVMEFLEGESLESFARRRVGALSVSDTLFILGALARALDTIHAAGIVHRDVKLDNVFLALDLDGRCVPKLLDFGIAKIAIAGETGRPSHRTRTGMLRHLPSSTNWWNKGELGAPPRARRGPVERRLLV